MIIEALLDHPGLDLQLLVCLGPVAFHHFSAASSSLHHTAPPGPAFFAPILYARMMRATFVRGNSVRSSPTRANAGRLNDLCAELTNLSAKVMSSLMWGPPSAPRLRTKLKKVNE